MYKIKRFSKDESKVNKPLVAGGILVSGSGINMIKDNKSKLTGLENLYHSTDLDNVEAIKSEGIKAKFADDPHNLTNRVVDDVDASKKTGKTYLGKKKSVSDGVGKARDMHLGGKSKTLNVNIPYEDYKKLKFVENPELRGAKNASEFGDKLLGKLKKEMGEEAYEAEMKSGRKIKEGLIKAIGKFQYDSLSDKGTAVIEGDIDSKYIKGSKNYQKYGMKDWRKYVGNNKGRFTKGALGATAGVGLTAGGAYIVHKGVKNKSDKKG